MLKEILFRLLNGQQTKLLQNGLINVKNHHPSMIVSKSYKKKRLAKIFNGLFVRFRKETRLWSFLADYSKHIQTFLQKQLPMLVNCVKLRAIILPISEKLHLVRITPCDRFLHFIVCVFYYFSRDAFFANLNSGKYYSMISFLSCYLCFDGNIVFFCSPVWVAPYRREINISTHRN